MPSTYPKESLVVVGRIASPHGVKGEVKIKPYTQDPTDMASYAPLWSEDGSRQFSFSVRGYAKGQCIAKIDGVSDRNDAERLKGITLCAPRDSVFADAPDEGEFYIETLVGLEVRTPDGAVYGHISSMQNYGAGDIAEVRPNGGGKKELYSFDDRTFPEVMPEEGYVVFEAPEVVRGEKQGG